MKLLIDMNLSPLWREVLVQADIDAIHWIEVGSPRATDTELCAWAKEHGYIVFTNDLDFGAILAATQAEAPSVFQVRTQDLTPDALSSRVIRTLAQHRDKLATGALITLDEQRARVRILPIGHE